MHDQQHAMVRAATADGRAVIVLGPPSVGKSAFVGEVCRRAGWPVWHGAALQILSARIRFLSLERAVRERLRDLSVDAAARRIEPLVGDGVLVVEDIQWDRPETLDVLGPLAGRIRVVLTGRDDPSLPSHIDRWMGTWSPEVIRLRHRPDHVLSPREHEILCHVASGRTTSDIAHRLKLRPTTIDTHVRSGMLKLGARTRLEAAAKLS